MLFDTLYIPFKVGSEVHLHRGVCGARREPLSLFFNLSVDKNARGGVSGNSTQALK